jgi:hypothetical protein
MKKCRCIKESSWFLIDDSLDKDSNLNGGRFSFQMGSEYDYFEEVTPWGNFKIIIHPKHGKENSIGFDERRFNEHFLPTTTTAGGK